MMHAASIDKSLRLQRVRDLLADGGEYSTLEICVGGNVCAVNSIIAELRTNGYAIECRQARRLHGGRVWLYRMTPSGPFPLRGKGGERTQEVVSASAQESKNRVRGFLPDDDPSGQEAA